MREWVRILCLTLLAMLINTSGNAQTPVPSAGAQVTAYTPTQITEIVKTSFQKDDFATLDKMATQFRTTKSRSSSGSWNLAIFYSNFRDAMYEGGKANSDEQWQRIEEKISRWVANNPNSATAPIFLAWAQLRHGWFYRGNGTANTVTEEGRRQFSRYVSMSANTLEKHKRVSSIDPEWYVMMLSLAKHRIMKDGEYALLYEEALKVEPLYHDIYKVVADAVSPAWGGSIAQLDALAADAVRRTTAVEGRALYARIFWSVLDRNSNTFGQVMSSGSWTLMKTGFEDMIRQYPDDWNRNAYAKFACQAGDVDTFIAMARTFNGKPMEDAWPGDYFRKCKEYAAKLRPNSLL